MDERKGHIPLHELDGVKLPQLGLSFLVLLLSNWENFCSVNTTFKEIQNFLLHSFVMSMEEDGSMSKRNPMIGKFSSNPIIDRFFNLARFNEGDVI